MILLLILTCTLLILDLTIGKEREKKNEQDSKK